MSTPNLKVIRPLKFGDVADFLTTKGITPKCTACGETTPSIFTAPDDVHANMFAMHPLDLNAFPAVNLLPNSVFVSVVTECANCGYQRHFSIDTIFQWLDGGKKELKT